MKRSRALERMPVVVEHCDVQDSLLGLAPACLTEDELPTLAQLTKLRLGREPVLDDASPTKPWVVRTQSSQDTRMKIRVEPYIGVLRVALEDRTASVESAFRESLRNLTLGTHARALGRLAAIVRTAWLQAWLRELRAKANGLARIEFAPAPPQAALHPTAIAEIILVSKDGPTLTCRARRPSGSSSQNRLMRPRPS